ncbi:hypothetical protein [Tomitella fengzijianii]|uniref:Uncharacterized protein n=1 Tax=Tomitella fengzijianii TaxID=2597660 RepID=A0A516X579_9ACTN|nr:hypothetical protein [Tomitella fengzijianii]QDQ98214.1 hypothetical protein FO059_13960 [Tomitella fengzijianii]
MTPFMLAVQDHLDGAPATAPSTTPSAVRTLAAAADTQVLIRSLAEQLLCEANVVLRQHGAEFTLVDESGPGALTFTIACADRSARIATLVDARSATAHIQAPGIAESRELAGEEQMQALLLSLVPATAGDRSTP